MSAYIVFNYDNRVVGEIFGVAPALPERNENYGFKDEWIVLNRPFFGDRTVRGVEYYKKDRGGWVPTLLFIKIDEQLAVRMPTNGPVLDKRFTVKDKP